MSVNRWGGLPDLTGEIEWQLTGSSSRRLGGSGLGIVGEASSVVLVLFDGLGLAQLEHEAGGAFRDSLVGSLASSFPTTPSVALSSVVTGLDPLGHGLTAHLMFRPELNRVVNTLKWVDLTGAPVDADYASVLPGMNLWERVSDAGFEPAYTYEEMVEATVALASQPGRLVFTYLAPVDVAGHVHGLGSREFVEAMRTAATVWDQLRSRLPSEVALLGTADHGLIEYSDRDKVLVRDPRFDGLRFGGDARGVQVWGDPEVIAEFADTAGGDVVDPVSLFGGGHPSLGDAVVMAPRGKVLLPPGFDKRLRCYHGGLDPVEVEVPLLVG